MRPHPTLHLQPTLTRWRLSWWLPPLLLVVLWGLVELVVQPWGNMPLGDDWSYAAAAERLATDGSLDRRLPTSTTLVAHTAWGALWVTLFGFSFEVLRLSVAVLGLGGLLALYQLAREVGLRPDRAFVAAVMIGLNPFYLKLSNSFMTDVSFTALAITALWLAVRSVRLEHAALFLLAIAAMAASVCVRQLGLAIPIAVAVTVALRPDWQGAYRWRLWVPTAVTALAYVGVNQFMHAGGAPDGYQVLSVEGYLSYVVTNPTEVLRNVVLYGGRLPLYWGLLLLPLVLLRLPKRPEREPSLTRLADILSGTFFGAWAVAAALKGNLYTIGDHFFDFGLGPLTVAGAYPFGSPAYGQLSAGTWLVLSLLGALGGALLVRALLYHIINIAHHWRLMGSARAYAADLTLVALLLLYTVPITTRGYFDRYLLLGWVPLVILLLRGTDPLMFFARWQRTALTVAAYAPLIWFSLAGTHDYLAWNRARHRALEGLLARGVPITQIDAGYEWNSTLAPRPVRYVPVAREGQSWWLTGDDRYRIAFDGAPGYRAVAHEPWVQWLWLPPRVQRITVWERTDAPSAAPQSP